MGTEVREAVAYLRVSTDMQVKDGVSLDNQRAKIEAYAMVNDLKVIEWITDEGKSGKSTKNRTVDRAIDLACERRCLLVTYSLSRLSRSLSDILAMSETLNKAGADFASLTEQFDTSTAAGRMIFRIFGVISQFEREILGERTSDALRFKMRKGERVSRHAPYGWFIDEDGTLGVNALEGIHRRFAIDIFKVRFSSGEKTEDALYGQIAVIMNSKGILYRGRRWCARDVQRIIEHARKIGEL